MGDLELLPAVEIETGPRPAAAVIWMHGLGADGHDFAPIVPELDLPARTPVRFVFPHAPVRPVTINAGIPMRAWYDVTLEGGARREDPAGVRHSARQIEALMAREKARGVPASRLVLAGFSQGGAMALHTGLRHPDRLAGLVALSTFLPLPDLLAAEAAPANRDLPIFMAHGTEDPLIPVSRGRRARDLLLALGYRVAWHQYPIPHSVCAEEIDALARWLGRLLEGADPFTGGASAPG
jgi:phospholipase/carboxylesterase